MVREWKYSNGFAPALDFCELVSMSDHVSLTDKQKDIFNIRKGGVVYGKHEGAESA